MKKVCCFILLLFTILLVQKPVAEATDGAKVNKSTFRTRTHQSVGLQPLATTFPLNTKTYKVINNNTGAVGVTKNIWYKDVEVQAGDVLTFTHAVTGDVIIVYKVVPEDLDGSFLVVW
ncbi:hypothetical protein [Chitinophaga qingshengii]|uniref:DUF3465 domain-containing protein n=1 Tax=Chitinophaga qingshengii TaxID=1569794 RepID=A0ABR7TFR8_9BACT|nr:hypothetical protein [Chitinophaga qingshengii]MBC9929164.1 hypothetical protein [Chitinophaga qingshengii]